MKICSNGIQQRSSLRGHLNIADGPFGCINFTRNLDNYTNKPIFLIQASNILSNLQGSNINALWYSDRLKHLITGNSRMKGTLVILGNTKAMMRVSSWKDSTVLKSFNQHWLKRSHFFSRYIENLDISYVLDAKLSCLTSCYFL